MAGIVDIYLFLFYTIKKKTILNNNIIKKLNVKMPSNQNIFLKMHKKSKS